MTRMRGIVARGPRRYTARMPAFLARSTAAALALAVWTADALAQPPARVTALGDTLVVRRCAAASCEVVATLPRGQSAPVLKTEHGWSQVVVTLEGSRATAGWVDMAQAAYAPRTAAGPSRVPDAQLAPRADAAPESAPGDCLTCVATRTFTPEEFRAAMKALPAPAPAPAPADPNAPTRADAVRRDGRSTAERMREELDKRFGDELKRLGEGASAINADLQTYMSACYERFLPPQVLPPGPTPPEGTPPLPPPRASVFEMWRGRPAWAWNDTWSTPALVTPDSSSFCQNMWGDLSTRAAEVKTRLDRVEADARAADIYPGVIRDALTSYGLSDGK